jgi:RNA polymerase sigma factor (sigma-70 family)
VSNEELVLSYQQGDKQALDILIDNNSGIVRKISLKYNNINKLLELDDLIQAGTIGLINAANKYDGDMENKANFITYAFQSIEREIQACVNGRSSKDINNTKFYKTVKSLNTPVGEEEDTELLNMIDSHDKSMEEIEDEIYIKQLRDELEGAMVQANTLREREVLKLHYGWNIEPITVNEIGDMFSIPGEKANQIKSIALRKIQNSVWGRTVGKKYRDEIIGPYECTYRDVEKKFDDELRSLYAM